MGTETIHTAQEACGILAQRALAEAHPKPTNPDGWLVSVERTIRTKHFATAKQLADDDAQLTPADLADMLEPTQQQAQTAPHPVAAVPGLFTERHACVRCGCYGGGGWLGGVRDPETGLVGRVEPCPDCAATRADMASRHVPTDRDVEWERKYREMSRVRGEGA